MHTTRITLFGTFITTAVLLTAALATEEWHEQVLVKKLEQEQATGIGAIFPFKDRPLTRSLGTVYVLDAQPPFSEAFMESLEWIPWQEVQGALVSDITLQFDDDSGIVYFYDNNGEIFYQEDPDPNNPFDPLWINKLHGYGIIVSRPINQYLLPSHVVGEYTLIVTEDAEEFRSGQMKMKLMKQPSATTSAPVPVDKKGIRFISMTTLANGFEFGFEVGECVAKAYHNHLTIKIEVLHSKDLTAPLESWTTLTNIPTPYISNPTESFFIPFTDVPGYVLNRPPLHDETCYTNAIVTTPSGQTITNAVYICGHPMTHPTEAGFFRLRIMDEGKEFGGITRVWLVEYSTPQQNLLAMFDADPSLAFANVFTDGNGGVSATGGLGWFDTGKTFQEFFFNNLKLREPSPPWAENERLDLPFRNYSLDAAWTMKIQGMGPTDSTVYILDNTKPGVADERILSFRKGNIYEISMDWKYSKDYGTSNPWTWYTWSAQVGTGLNNYANRPDYSGRTFVSYIPIRRSGVSESILGFGYFLDNTDGLMTYQVSMNNNPNQAAGYGGGGNVVKNQNLKAYLYTIKPTFITPAGDPTNPNEMNDEGEGQNQYTFSNTNPGVLTMNLKVKIEPSGLAEKIAPLCKFTVDNIGAAPYGSLMQWDPANSNGVPTAVGDYLCATVTFTKLPSYNNSFGWKTVKFWYKYSSIYEELASTKYGVFFPRDEKNHPPCTVKDCGDCPNWFYYWKQGQVCGIPLGTSCIYFYTNRQEIAGFVLPLQDSIIRLCDAASKESKQHTFYSINPSIYPNIDAGRDGKGIFCVYFTVVHEQYHLKIYKDFKSSIGTLKDLDEDWIPNIEEQNGWGGIITDHWTNDTYRVIETLKLKPDYKFGDQEIRCELAVHKLNPTNEINKIVFPEKDWANPGCQSKDLWGRPPETTP